MNLYILLVIENTRRMSHQKITSMEHLQKTALLKGRLESAVSCHTYQKDWPFISGSAVSGG